MLLTRPSRPQLALLVCFLATYVLAGAYLRILAAPDPSSYFFNPAKGYSRHYTDARIREANDFIAQDWSDTTRHLAGLNPSICIGVPTVQRTNARYFRTTIGSLLRDLSNDERLDMKLMPFIANPVSSEHQAFGERWLSHLVDDTLTFEQIPESDKAMLRQLDGANAHMAKTLFDYRFVLERCYLTGAPYVLVLEDDVIAAPSWYNHTKGAIRELESQPQVEYERSLYLRLFYNTRIQGWNSELWLHYLFWSMTFELFLTTGLLCLRRYNQKAAQVLSLRALVIIVCALAPACVGLYFAAGRLTVQPYRHGIHRMDNYGCCSQALLFPRAQIPPLLQHLRDRIGNVDTLIERYANDFFLARWALSPSVFQHVGSRSSKWTGNDGSKEFSTFDRDGLRSTERIWNFQFEDWEHYMD